MSSSDYSDLDDDIINVTPRKPGRRMRLRWIILAAVVLLIVLWRALYVYVDSLWYGSLGFASRFWYVLELGWLLFAIFGVLTFTILRGGFYLLERWFRVDKLVPRTIVVNKQPVEINVFRYLRPVGWGVAIFFGLIYGLALSGDWNTWVLYLDQPATAIVYWPMLIKEWWTEPIDVDRTVTYVIRSDRVGSTGFLRELQQAVWSVNPNVPLASVRTLDEQPLRSDCLEPCAGQPDERGQPERPKGADR